jgi:NAD(P)-dependent dehydrogenase (short-subunit alcohol dehydrogenase family)
MRSRARDPFAERVALVTGGASGIGRALCEALARHGARVTVADLDGEGAQRVASALGAPARAATLDVTDAGAVRAAVDALIAREGRLDLLVNGAGLGFWGELRDATLDDWRRVLDVNLWGVVHGVAAAYPRMVAQGGGQIVNVASLAGLVSAPIVTPYAAAKHAVVGLSTSLRAEAEGLGVRVNVVCPGPIQTAFHSSLIRAGGPAPGPAAPAGALDAAAAARAILRGVARNERIIVFPARARRLWWAYRWLPARIARLNRATVQRVRARRPADASGTPGAEPRPDGGFGPDPRESA